MSLELTEQCWKCDGEGKIEARHLIPLSPIYKDTPHAEVECDYCKGTGYRLTTEGQELVEFLNKFTNIKINEKLT